MKEYIITLKHREDLDAFYEDMETEGGSLYIPHRKVECHCRRPLSRNTHYMLTDEEAEQVKRDPRVHSVELSLTELNVVVEPSYIQTSSQWSRSTTSILSGDLNHGLLRGFEGQDRPSWRATTATSRVTGTIQTPRDGENVDVVILDGDLDKNHPEFAMNPDGTGGTRMIEYNWFALNPIVDPSNPATQYSYNIFNSANSRHGHAVAGIAVGNTQGAAKHANIYNLNPYSEKGLSSLILFDYIRAFHNAKTVNPNTGVKNPTIVNASIQFVTTINVGSITAVLYRGSTYTSPFTDQQLKDFDIVDREIYPGQSSISLIFYSEALKADIQDMIDDGVVFIACAGNSNLKIDSIGGIDYDNIFSTSTTGYYYCRGGGVASPGSSIIISSSCNSKDGIETRSVFSNAGSGVDVFASGEFVTTSTLSGESGLTVVDPRNTNYKKVHFSGTSASCPQVCGIVACLLQTFKSWNQESVRSWLQAYSKSNQLSSYTQTVFNPSLNERIHAGIALPDNSIVIGGRFTTVNGISRDYIARINEDGTLNNAFSGTYFNQWVYSIASLSGENRILVGSFTGQIAKYDYNGVLDNTFSASANNAIWCITPQLDGKIMIGGSFTTVNGVSRSRIARLNSNGSLDTTFSATVAPNWVNQINFLPDGGYLLTGLFSTINSVSRVGIGKVSSTGVLSDDFNLNLQSGSGVLACEPLSDGGFLIGGGFTSISGQNRVRIAKISSNGTLSSEFASISADYIGSGTSVQDIEVFADGSIIVVGSFATLGNCIGKINPDGTKSNQLNINSLIINFFTGEVLKIIKLFDDSFVVGGRFTSIDGFTRNYIAKFPSDLNSFTTSNLQRTYTVSLKDSPNKFIYFDQTTLYKTVFLPYTSNNSILLKDGKILTNQQTVLI